MSWLQMRSGARVHVADPDPGDIFPGDIALGLARICRFNGQVRAAHYSVAEHCVLMSRCVDADIALHCLLHDAAEAYLGDVVMPVKRMLQGYDALETGMLVAIYVALGVAPPSAEQERRVKTADLRMLATEKAQLLADLGDAWPVLQGVEPFFECRIERGAGSGEQGDGGKCLVPTVDIVLEIPCWDAARAKREWLYRLFFLVGRLRDVRDSRRRQLDALSDLPDGEPVQVERELDAAIEKGTEAWRGVDIGALRTRGAEGVDL